MKVSFQSDAGVPVYVIVDGARVRVKSKNHLMVFRALSRSIRPIFEGKFISFDKAMGVLK